MLSSCSINASLVLFALFMCSCLLLLVVFLSSFRFLSISSFFGGGPTASKQTSKQLAWLAAREAAFETHASLFLSMDASNARRTEKAPEEQEQE